MKKVSVIVPVYNVVDYLPQCLDSIVRQTYAHLEIILVDDGSTDGSGDLCDQWAQCDSRIRVIHKPNGGPSEARNAALDVMTGQLVMMVDSDDYISPDCIETLMAVMHDTGSDLSIGSWRLFAGSPPACEANGKPFNVKTFGRDEAIQMVFYQNTITNSPCSRLYKASLFDQVRFPEGMLYEDLAIIYPILLKLSLVAYADHVVYFYRQHAASITGHFTRQRTDVLKVMENLERQMQHENQQYLPAVRSRLLSAYFNILLLCPDQPDYAPVADHCWRGIKRLRWGCLRDRNVRMKNRLGILASVTGQKVFTTLFRGRVAKRY